MKINSLNFALASAITAAIVWVICSLLVWIMPGPIMSIAGDMVHMNLTSLGLVLSLTGFIWGLIVWSLFAGIFAWLLAAIYNRLTKN